jgi:hypothetical protein
MPSFEVNNTQILAIYMAQSENVRHLKQVMKSFQRDINLDIKKKNEFQIKAKTKILSLLYSAWSEAQFVQIVFTEKGFSYAEICILTKCKQDKGITQAWYKMITMAIEKIGCPKTDQILKTRLKKLKEIIKTYIEQPSTLRNKIAHGQWINALKKTLDTIDQNTSTTLDELDPVVISKQIEIHQHLGKIVRDLVQSPSKGFSRDYINNIANLENYIIRTKSWSLIAKQNELSRKPIDRAPKP